MSFADKWKQVAAEAAKELAAEDEKEPTAEINLSDGCEFVGRRLPWERWTRAGKVPQALTLQTIRLLRREQSQVRTEDMSTADVAASLKFQVDAICYCVVDPKIVTHTEALKEGEVRYSDIFEAKPEWIDKVMTWVLQGCPGVPVKTKGGDVPLEDIQTFPDGARRHKRARSRKGVPVLSCGEAKPTTGHPV